MSTVIKIENLSKEYTLGGIGHRLLYRDVQSWIATLLGKEDPNAVYTLDGKVVSSLSKDKFWALKNISFEIKDGEVLGIIGRNGAGKSTLLKILSRITAPTSGQIKIKGRISSLLEVGTGFHPELTGRENIFLNGSILGMRKKEIEKKLDEIISFSEIENFIDTPVKRYSSGMYVRLAFAVAAHLEPEILIVDEVLAVGDAAFQKKCLGKMNEVAQGGRTVIFVSHNLATLRQLCSSCIFLKKGELMSIGPSDMVVDEYLNDMGMNPHEYSCPSDKSKKICLLKVQLVDKDGNSAQQVEYQSGFKIKLQYEVNKPVENCIVWLAFSTPGDTHLFCVADYDYDISLLNSRKAGIYEAVISFPESFIKPGTYMVVVGISGQAPLISYERVEAIAVTVVDSITETVLSEMRSRSGFINPPISWITVQA